MKTISWVQPHKCHWCRLLRKFLTPFGRYYFNRFPFEICSAPKVSQRTMSSVLEGLESVICHVDDTLIYAQCRKCMILWWGWLSAAFRMSISRSTISDKTYIESPSWVMWFQVKVLRQIRRKQRLNLSMYKINKLRHGKCFVRDFQK